MKNIFVNLKRFDVPRNKGGVCPKEDPGEWIEEVVEKSVELGIGLFDGIHTVFFVPEALIIPARRKLAAFPESRRGRMEIGCQGVYRKNIEPGKNFGAFTTSMPAASAYQMGCRWSIIGHSEERRDKQEIIGTYEPYWNSHEELRRRCLDAVEHLVNQEVLSALKQGMDVLLCIGETAEERGNAGFEETRGRIKYVLSRQIEQGLRDCEAYFNNRRIMIGYEPVWAIGPGKTPPDREYIAFVSGTIKKITKELYNVELPVVYGGGLKEENAGMVSGIESIDGGLVALTRFTGEIGFNVEDLLGIMEKYHAHQTGGVIL